MLLNRNSFTSIKKGDITLIPKKIKDEIESVRFSHNEKENFAFKYGARCGATNVMGSDSVTGLLSAMGEIAAQKNEAGEMARKALDEWFKSIRGQL